MRVIKVTMIVKELNGGTEYSVSWEDEDKEVYALKEAPGSTLICLSAKSRQIRPQKCNNFNVKGAMWYKGCHVNINDTENST